MSSYNNGWKKYLLNQCLYCLRYSTLRRCLLKPKRIRRRSIWNCVGLKYSNPFSTSNIFQPSCLIYSWVVEVNLEVGLNISVVTNFFFSGDHDAVLVLLLIPRMICKCDILLIQVRDKYQNVDKIDRNSVLKNHTVEQYTFRTRFSYYIYALQVENEGKKSY